MECFSERKHLEEGLHWLVSWLDLERTRKQERREWRQWATDQSMSLNIAEGGDLEDSHVQPLPITKEASDLWRSHCPGGTQSIKPRALPIPPSLSSRVLSIVPIPDPSWDVYSRGDSHHNLTLFWLLSGKFCLGAFILLVASSLLVMKQGCSRMKRWVFIKGKPLER